MADQTVRFRLPLLVPGQGQKDITHNEALLALDALAQPAARSRALAAPPDSPAVGQCWLVAGGAAGVWAGRAGQLATWTAGGWRYFTLPDGATVWIDDEEIRLRASAGGWVVEAPRGYPASAVPDVAGGAVVDVEARAAIAALLDRMHQLGLISA
jgi:hypothetical protein